MSKITNESLTRCGTGCFIAVPIWQVSVKGLKIIDITVQEGCVVSGGCILCIRCIRGEEGGG